MIILRYIIWCTRGKFSIKTHTNDEKRRPSILPSSFLIDRASPAEVEAAELQASLYPALFADTESSPRDLIQELGEAARASIGAARTSIGTTRASIGAAPDWGMFLDAPLQDHASPPIVPSAKTYSRQTRSSSSQEQRKCYPPSLLERQQKQCSVEGVSRLPQQPSNRRWMKTLPHTSTPAEVPGSAPPRPRSGPDADLWLRDGSMLSDASTASTITTTGSESETSRLGPVSWPRQPSPEVSALSQPTHLAWRRQSRSTFHLQQTPLAAGPATPPSPRPSPRLTPTPTTGGGPPSLRTPSPRQCRPASPVCPLSEQAGCRASSARVLEQLHARLALGPICRMSSSDEEPLLPAPARFHEPPKKRLTCPLNWCGMTARDANALQRHLLRHSLAFVPDRRFVRCKLCRDTFPTAESLHRHLRRHSEARILHGLDHGLICSTCHDWYRNPVRLARHKRAMHGARADQALSRAISGQLDFRKASSSCS